MADSLVADRTYDASGLLCPLPVLRANRMLRELAPGQTLKVLATDPAAEADFPAYCRQTGHTLVGTGREGAVLVFLIRKKDA
ncbi:sulfurtransferase TusA family protein [Vineibacter terrae]|uniref:Sulfurtransferase TusA family protein n=1 Tax=Vineibacter terrae TaxID=2586908 RepID=A0A5C8PB01_9HYPH|nr:sulfurtransferase TusA family protein [Vineibacter terrae]TXL70981.1 sulfurtransferase TusA family protein [Vineibacter terrae]HEX2890696.1 sulfurtransferase TusA family protein [Vineibacter terrae]